MKSLLAFGFCMSILFIGTSTALADAPSSVLQPISPYSPNNLLLQWGCDETVNDVSYSIYHRLITEDKPGPWEKVSGLELTSATQGYFKGTHNQKVEFRSAAFSKEGAEMVELADFEFAGKGSVVSAVVSIGGFSRSMQLHHNAAIQGKGCFQFSFSSHYKNEDKKDIPSDALIGLRFNKNVPTRDWSSYRYLEFYYSGNVPDGMELWIESKRIGDRSPINRFSLDGDEFNQWHSIVVDLNELLGDPENRKDIKTLAFIKPIHQIDLTKEYRMRIDAVRLWKNRDFSTTVIDDTAPPAPSNLKYKLKPISIDWTWTAPQDDLSGIQGYACFLTQDRRKPFIKKIDTTKNFISIPFLKPQAYQEYHFMVAAQNNAGIWSPVTQKSVTFRP